MPSEHRCDAQKSACGFPHLMIICGTCTANTLLAASGRPGRSSMVRLMRLMTGGTVTVLVMLSAAALGQAGSVTGAQAAVVRAALAPGSINNIMVIDLENENETSTFGSGSAATYLNNTLVPKGELLQNYYATGHVSLDKYIEQITGQAPTPLTDSDCDLGEYVNVTPGTDEANG